MHVRARNSLLVSSILQPTPAAITGNDTPLCQVDVMSGLDAKAETFPSQ